MLASCIKARRRPQISPSFQDPFPEEINRTRTGAFGLIVVIFGAVVMVIVVMMSVVVINTTPVLITFAIVGEYSCMGSWQNHIRLITKLHISFDHSSRMVVVVKNMYTMAQMSSNCYFTLRGPCRKFMVGRPDLTE